MYSFAQECIPDWSAFASLASYFGFQIRVSGGMINTHEINCSASDFVALRELSLGRRVERMPPARGDRISTAEKRKAYAAGSRHEGKTQAELDAGYAEFRRRLSDDSYRTVKGRDYPSSRQTSITTRK